MELESLNCNNCGAPLEVSTSANFVTCSHCSTRLAVRRTETSAFTEQLESIDAKQNEMLDRLARIERQTDLADLDRQGEREQAAFMVSDKSGHKRLPFQMGGVISGIVAIFGLFWTIIAGSMFRPMALFGILFMGIAIYGGFARSRKLQAYEEAHARYQTRKRELLSRRTDEEQTI